MAEALVRDELPKKIEQPPITITPKRPVDGNTLFTSKEKFQVEN
jgi:hypothetical protein